MSTQLIARNWALAFFNAARDTGKLDAALKDAALLTQVLKSEETLLIQLSSPKLSLADRSNILKNALSAHITDLTLNFLNQVLKYRRLNLLLEILEEFFLVNSQNQKVLKATLTSAKELNNSQKKRLQDEMQRKTGCTLDIQYRIDPGLLAGFVLVYEDKMYDCSIKGALNRLKRMLDV